MCTIVCVIWFFISLSRIFQLCQDGSFLASMWNSLKLVMVLTWLLSYPPPPVLGFPVFISPFSWCFHAFWVENVLSKGNCVLFKATAQWPWWGLNLQHLDLMTSTLPLILSYTHSWMMEYCLVINHWRQVFPWHGLAQIQFFAKIT